MSHLFSQIPRAQIQRSSFNRSHTYKTATLYLCAGDLTKQMGHFQHLQKTPLSDNLMYICIENAYQVSVGTVTSSSVTVPTDTSQFSAPPDDGVSTFVLSEETGC